MMDHIGKLYRGGPRSPTAFPPRDDTISDQARLFFAASGDVVPPPQFISADALLPNSVNPTCATCGDITYTKDRATGKLVHCPNCNPFLPSRRPLESRLADAGVSQGYRSVSFGNENAAYIRQHPKVKAARDAAFQMARGQASFKWLVMIGDPGWGKTRLAVCVMRYRIERGTGPPGRIVRVPDLLNELRQALQDGRYADEMGRLRALPMLMLDDLGAERSTPWAQEQQYLLIEGRHSDRIETIITSNAPLGELEPRIQDRLLGSSEGFVSAHYIKGVPSYRSGG